MKTGTNSTSDRIPVPGHPKMWTLICTKDYKENSNIWQNSSPWPPKHLHTNDKISLPKPTKLTNPNPKLKTISATISTAENHGKTAITENHEGDFVLPVSIWVMLSFCAEIWVLLTSNFNIFVVTSALGVVASAALKRRQLLEITCRADTLQSRLNLNYLQMQALCLTTAYWSK